MDRIKRRRAFTLAEVMIVLLVLTLLLAVFAPFITKRRSTNKQGEELWRWATRNYLAGPMDAFFNPPDRENASLFIGMTPDSREEIDEIYAPLGKIIIRGGYIDNETIQHQIQFRYGRTNSTDSIIDIGTYAGSLLADNSNLLLGAKFEKMVPKIADSSYPQNNIAIGFEALNSIGENKDGTSTNPALNNVAIGHRASEFLVSGDNNVTVGSGAGAVNILGSQNTIVGTDAGFKTNNSNNTLIGYKSTSGSGVNNTFIGALTGQQADYPKKEFSYNTAIGYNALSSITQGNYNIAIGTGALRNLQQGSYNVAIGYNACAGLVHQSNKTCIGYNSGPAKSSGANAEILVGIDDKSERTYIGTNQNVTYSADGTETWNPRSYGGDATLEIHNVGNNNANLINNPSVQSNTTTVINGDLVVMGKTYLTVGNILYPFGYENNLFGAYINNPCSNNQTSYAFHTDDTKCSDLSNLTSDRRLKNIESKYKAGLEEINQIKVYNYTFKADKDKQKQTGVIAQQLQKIFPNSVFKGKDGYLKIRWDEMFYASINAIKELNHKISALMKQALNLESKIQKLEKENSKLQTETDALAKRVEALKNKQ